MIIDSSALIALVQHEPTVRQIAAALINDPQPVIPSPTATECLIVLTSRLGPVGRTAYERLRTEFGIVTGHYVEAHVTAAVEAYARFGKGRHPASLNFGDCMSYAAALVSGEPLLAVGDDFPHTDLEFDGGVVGFWRSR